MQKPLTVWITKNYGKFLKRWVYQTTLLASWEPCMQVKKQQFELDMQQWIGFKIGKVVWQGYILSACLFNLYTEYIMQNARLDESPAGIEIAGYVPVIGPSDVAESLPARWQIWISLKWVVTPYICWKIEEKKKRERGVLLKEETTTVFWF